MKEQFIPYNLALRLKELGFDAPCLGVWNTPNGEYEVTLVYGGNLHKGYLNDLESFKVTTPLWQQAFDWLFKEFNFWQYTFPNAHNKNWCYHIQWYKESFGWGEAFIQNGFKTQEEARLECLKKLIELCEKN